MRGDTLQRLESNIDEAELQRGASLSKAGGPRGTISAFFSLQDVVVSQSIFFRCMPDVPSNIL